MFRNWLFGSGFNNGVSFTSSSSSAQSLSTQSLSSSNTEKRLDKLSVELKVEFGDDIGDILCLFLGSGDGVSSKPRSFLHFGDGVKWIFLFCLFLGSGDGVSSRTHCRFLHSGDGVKLTTRGLFLKVTDGTNGDDVGVEEADDGDVHGESG